MKKHKIIFWITTGAIFLFEGVMPALFSGGEDAKAGFTHLGYPLYFIWILTVFKVLGSLALIIPKVPSRVKEWAYAGFGFDFISAFISLWVVDGFSGLVFLPVVAIVILVISYVSYHKMKAPMSMSM